MWAQGGGGPTDSLASCLDKGTRGAIGLTLPKNSLEGDVPADFKHAVVQPLIKKLNLDAGLI